MSRQAFFIMRRLLAWLVLLAPLGGAHALPAGFKFGDGPVGPTCAHYLGMGPLAWANRGGDWLDARGQLQGGQAFSKVLVHRDIGINLVELDVTPLFQFLGANPRLPTMIALRTVEAQGGDVIDFHSRESQQIGGRPVLKVTWQDGTRSRLLPAADTFLDCSTLRSLGQEPLLKVGGSFTTLLRFELPQDKPIKSAELLLSTAKQWGGARTQVGAFAVQPPFAKETPVETGLAWAQPDDQGLSQHPEVLFASGFDDNNWLQAMGLKAPADESKLVQRAGPNQFEPLSGQALQVTLARGKNLGLDMRYKFARHPAGEPEQVFFRYYLRFGDDWNPHVDGGKLPGIAGTYGRAGWGMRRSDGRNGWSMRGSFDRRVAGDASVQNLSAIGSYAYHAAQGENSGETWPWSAGPGGLLQNNRWYCVEQYVRLNQPGQADGVAKAWVDGRLVMQRDKLRFRDVAELRIEEIWFDVFHGGTAPAPADMSLYIDNIVIAKRYIGPLRPAANKAINR